MGVKITIQSRKEEVIEQKQDIDTYYSMINDLLKRINAIGLHMSYIDIRKKGGDLKKGLELAVEVTPSALFEGDQLKRLWIKVNKKEALDIVKNVLKDYSDKYHFLESVDIDTYF